MIVKIINIATGRQVAEIPVSVLREDGWKWLDFLVYQSKIGRECEIGGDDHVPNR